MKKAVNSTALFDKEKVFLWGLQPLYYWGVTTYCSVKILGVFTVIIIAENFKKVFTNLKYLTNVFYSNFKIAFYLPFSL